MKIALIVDRFDANNSANICIAYNIGRELRKKHDVYIYGKHDCYSEGVVNQLYESEVGKQYAFESKINIKINELRKSIKCEESTRKEKIKKLITSPILCSYILLNRISAYFFDNVLEVKSVRRDLERFVNVNNIECLIAITAPIDTVKEIKTIKNVKKIWYQLDPYSFNVYTKNKIKALKKEKQILQSIDFSFVTKQIYNEYKNSKLSIYLNKVQSVEFPNLVRKHRDEKQTKSQESEINCIYAGNFYKQIRNPDLLLEKFSEIQNENIKLHLYGTGCEEEVDFWVKKSKGKIINHGRVSISEVDNLIMNGDILVSLNNSNINQMPSKIIEYISTGLPIINVCQMADCPTIEYVRKYPLAYNIIEGEFGDVESLETFITSNVGKTVDWNYISETYCEFTPQTVVDKMEKVFGSDKYI